MQRAIKTGLILILSLFAISSFTSSYNTFACDKNCKDCKCDHKKSKKKKKCKCSDEEANHDHDKDEKGASKTADKPAENTEAPKAD